MQHLIILSAMFAVFVIHVEGAAKFAMNLGQFNSKYAVYMTYSIESKGTLSLNLQNKEETLFYLHVNPRYQSDGGCTRSAMVLNNYLNGKWQTEIRPSGFPFLYNKISTVIVIPQTNQYEIIFDVSGRTFIYTFPFRKGHQPEQVRKLVIISLRMCKSPKDPEISSFGTGFVVPSLPVGSVIYIDGTAPSNGIIVIDVSAGTPGNKNRANIALKIRATFGTDRKLFFDNSIKPGATLNETSVSNPIQNGATFKIYIAIMQRVYWILIDGVLVGTVVPNTHCVKNPATIWATGMATLDNIRMS